MEAQENQPEIINVRNTIAQLGGRPSKFKWEMLPKVTQLCKIGATDTEIADFLEISVPTLYEWQSKYPKFSKAFDKGKSQLDRRVTRSLYHRAVGFEHNTTKVFNDKGQPVAVNIREHLPPDTNAAIFWLKNRKPEAWQDRSVVDGSISLNVGELVAKGRQRVLAAKAQAPILDAETIE
jgi:hypothetical protein